MPEVNLEIGGRTFIVACQEGEEPSLQQAAALLNTEAEALQSALGRVPEARMLLMAGLMLADRTAEVADRAVRAEEQLGKLNDHVSKVEARASDLASRTDDGSAKRDLAAALDVLARAADRAERLSGS